MKNMGMKRLSSKYLENFRISQEEDSKSLDSEELNRRLDNCRERIANPIYTHFDFFLDKIFRTGRIDFHKMDCISLEVYEAETKNRANFAIDY